MRKRLCHLLLLGFVMGALPASFVSKVSSATVPATKKVNIVMATAGAGTGIFVRFAGIAEAIKKTAPNYQITLLTGTTVTNLKRLARGTVDISFINTPSVELIKTGAKPYGKPIPIKVITKNGLSPVQFFVLSKTGLTSVRDLLKRKYPLKVNVGRRNSDPELAVRNTLKEYGITYDDIKSWGGKLFWVMASTEGVRVMQDGLAEGQFFCGTLSAEAGRQIGKMDVTVFSIEEDIIKKMVARGFERVTVKTGALPFIKQNLETIAMVEMLISRPGLPEEVVYTITRAIWENRDYLKTVHRQFVKYLDPDFFASPPRGVSWHPGSRKYYREMGWVK